MIIDSLAFLPESLLCRYLCSLTCLITPSEHIKTFESLYIFSMLDSCFAAAISMNTKPKAPIAKARCGLLKNIIITKDAIIKTIAASMSFFIF